MAKIRALSTGELTGRDDDRVTGAGQDLRAPRSLQNGEQLAVAQAAHRFVALMIPGVDEALYLGQPAVCEHAVDAVLDRTRERMRSGVEHDEQQTHARPRW